MATSASVIAELLEHLAAAGDVSARKMFGEYCLYLDDVPVGVVCDDCLFVKITPGGEKLATELERGIPYPGGRAHLVVPIDAWGDEQRMCELVRAAANEVAKAKRRRRAKD